MPDDLERVAQAVNRLVPEPPTPITVERLMSFQATHVVRPLRAPTWRWLPAAVAAAVVLAAAVGISVFAHRGNDVSPRETTGHSHTLPTAGTGRVLVPRITPGSRLPKPGHWPAHVLAPVQTTALAQLVSIRQSLYLISDDNLLRFDPATGAVPTMSVPVSADSSSLIAADGSLWVSRLSGTQLVITRFSPSLRVLGTARTAIAARSTGPALAASNRTGSAFFASTGTALYRLNVASMTLRAEALTGSTPICSLGVAGDGTLYLGHAPDVATGGASADTVDSYTLTAGGLRRRFSASVGTLEQSALGLAASTNSAWLVTSTGTADEALLLAVSGQDATSVDGTFSGSTAVTVQRGVTWLAGLGHITCANSSTGTVLGSTALPESLDRAGSVTTIGTTLYAIVSSPKETTITAIDAPAACTSAR